MAERKKLAVTITTQSVDVLSEQRGSLVGRGLVALRKDNEALYRQARVVFDRRHGSVYRNWNAADDPATFSAFKIFQKLANENYGRAFFPLHTLCEPHFEFHKQSKHFAQMAFDWCYANRDNQDAELWGDLGRMCSYGYGVSQDYKEAMKWYRKAAEVGDARAQFRLGEMFEYGTGVPQDGEEALKWYRLAAEKSNLGALMALAERFSRDTEDQINWYQLAADQGHDEAQVWLGDCYANGMYTSKEDVPKDFVELLKWRREAADYEEAVKWYRLAAAQGNSEAQYELGGIYVDGEGVPQNHEEAVKWYRLAADRGDERAQNVLGSMYAEGQGVPQNYEDAVRWFRLAAKKGNPYSQCHLGDMYRDGRGVPQNYKEAVKWYLLAAERYSAAIDSLKRMYAAGQCALQDYEDAVKRRQLAKDEADRSSARYTEALNRLAAQGDADAR